MGVREAFRTRHSRESRNPGESKTQDPSVVALPFTRVRHYPGSTAGPKRGAEVEHYRLSKALRDRRLGAALFHFGAEGRMIEIHAGAPAEKFAGSEDPAPHRRRPSLFPES